MSPSGRRIGGGELASVTSATISSPVRIHNSDSAQVDLAALRQEVLRDAAWAAQLAAISDPDRFAGRLVAEAAARGLVIAERQVRDTLRSDPLGLSRFATDPGTQAHWPPQDWLPVHVDLFNPRPTIDWAWFGRQSITAPFFEGDVRSALAQPFNQFMRYRMTLADFVAAAPRQAAASVAPAGFIFHMSRCGSTLVSQMLTQSPRHTVISEAAPIDAAARMNNGHVLRAMMAAYGRPRGGDQQRLFIKLDAWHAMALPLFMRTFPDVPWIFLYRDPVEVLVSQAREPGPQLLRQITPPALYGLDDTEDEPDLDYIVRALDRICNAAADALASPGGLAINYRDLPEAVEARILPHFGFSLDEAERAALRAAARFDAKAPASVFSADSTAKQALAPAALRDLADRTLRGAIGRLDALAATRR